MPPDDGTIHIPTDSENEEPKMPQVDLSENVANQLLTETVGNIQSANRRGRDTSDIAEGVLKGAMARNFDELGTTESRANSGVIATPVASPAVQQG